jgi:AraC-like DNA-binding protein
VRLADAIRNAERYSKIVNEGVRVRFSLERTATITLDYVNVDRHSDRHQMEFWLVALMRICRHVTETRLAPSRLKVRHSGFGREEMKSFFGRDVDYEADADTIAFPAPMASLPIVGRDPYLNDLLRKYADEALSNQLSRRANLGAQVEKIAAQLLPHGKADVSEISRQLGMSPRSLSRKLQDEGVTCAEILEELKVVLAKRYLSESELPVSEIAWLLGYSEISSLTHAFKRWTGMTPRQFRLYEAARR